MVDAADRSRFMEAKVELDVSNVVLLLLAQWYSTSVFYGSFQNHCAFNAALR